MFEIRLLGSFQLKEGETGLPAPRRKTRALLGYLAAAGPFHARAALSDLFCRDAKSPARALSVLLSRARKRLPPDALRSEGKRVGLDETAVSVDYTRFQAILARDLAAQEEAALDTAVSLYRGDLLAGLTLPDAPEFELWLLGERARARHLYEEGLLHLIDRRAARGDDRAAIAAAQQLLQSNPLLEAGHAHLIRLYARGGQRAAALAQYEQCRALLDEELAVAPAPALQQLYAEVQAGRLATRPKAATQTAVSPPPPSPSPDLVARREELARLGAAWEATRGGAAPPLLVEGPAGVGKTELVAAFAAGLPGVALLRGPCYESTQSTPYAPWIQVLETYLANGGVAPVDALPDHWRAELARLLPSLARRYETAVAGKREHLFNAVAELLLGSADPLLLFIDDLQWADAASLALFHVLAGRLARTPRAPILLLGALRSEEQADNPALLALRRDLRRGVGVERLRLSPLPVTAVAELIARHWPDLPAGYRVPHLRDKVFQATGGNPLFVIEIAHELAEAETAPAALPVPPSLRELAARRLARLPASGRQVIEALAVLDNPGAFSLLQQISARSDEETAAALEAGLGWRLLETVGASPAPAYDFRHDLLRRAVLRQVSAVRRPLLHGRAARALETSGADAAVLAFHWGMAGERAKEGHYAALAGRAAAALYAHAEAIRYLKLAADRLEDPGRRLDVLGELGNVYVIAGQWEEAEAVFRRGLALAEAETDRAGAARFQGAWGQLMSRRGRYPQALSYLQQALATSEALDDAAGMARYVGAIGIVHFMRDDLEQALACYREALALQEERGDEAAMVVWQTNIAGIYNQLGRHQDALRLYQQAVAANRALGEKQRVAIGLGNLGDTYHHLGDFRQAFHHHLQALQMRHEMADKAGVGVVLELVGGDYLAVGDLERAESCFSAALGVNVAVGREEGAATCLGELGVVALRRGEEETAVRRLTASISRLRRLGVRHHLGRALLALAEAHAAAGRWEAAAAPVAEAVELLDDQDEAFRGQILLAGVRFQREATASLVSLLPAAATERQRAGVLAALAAAGAASPAQTAELAGLYRRLHQVSPRAEYRRGYTALTGEMLPAPETPPLPALIHRYAPPDSAGLIRDLIEGREEAG